MLNHNTRKALAAHNDLHCLWMSFRLSEARFISFPSNIGKGQTLKKRMPPANCETLSNQIGTRIGDSASIRSRNTRLEVSIMSIRKTIIITLLIGVLATALAGCASESTDFTETQPADRGDASKPSTSEEAPSLPGIEPSDTLLNESLIIEPATGGVPTEIMEEIAADLVKRTSVQLRDIQVARTEAVVWNDGSLGCPKPGEFYIQMMISGYWVVLEVEGVEYDYRVSDSGHFKLCEGGGMPPINLSDTSDQTQNPLVIQAKEDLATRLGIKPSEIELLKYEEVVWPDSSLGCPQPGMEYLQVPSDGALIRLSAMDQVYDYHSGGNRGVFLCEQLYKDPKPPPKIDITDLKPQIINKNTPTTTTPDNSIPPGEDH
jgi:hypothetical protein